MDKIGIFPDFFASDLHFGHVNIIKFCERPFDDVPHMNAELVRLWNEVVSPTDTVFILGDLCMGVIRDSMAFAAQLNGHKFLVPGNHDRIHPSYEGKKFDEMMDLYEDAGFQILPTEFLMDLAVGGPEVVVSHFPYEGDHTEKERYTEYRPEDTGKWLIHGHVHDLYKVRGRQINVGVDVWNLKPVSTATLIDIIEAS